MYSAYRYQVLKQDAAGISIDDVFDIGMEVARRFFKNDAAASTFVIKHQGGVRQATRFGLLKVHAIEMFEEAAKLYKEAEEFAKPWEIGSQMK